MNDPLTPSVDIQADAVAQLLHWPRAPRRPGRGRDRADRRSWPRRNGARLALSPLAGVPLTIALIGVAWAGSALLSLWSDRLLDPLAPTLGAAVVFGVSALSSYASTRRREARVRRRFEQHLAPAGRSPHRRAAAPSQAGGERRELIALFTDIESFTAMTHSADPARLVALMDEYVEGLSAIMIKHGAMVDKVVGDAVHALFNAPLDLDRHAAHAVDCAVEIRDWTAAFRLRSPAATWAWVARASASRPARRSSATSACRPSSTIRRMATW